jgi:hypothetical protein
MLYLAQAGRPQSMLDVLLWPVLLTIAGCGIFYMGWYVENRLTKAPWKWIALLPIGYAMMLGWGYVSDWSEAFYRADVGVGNERKMMAAHYGALIIPILGVIAIVLFHFFNHKLHLSTDED